MIVSALAFSGLDFIRKLLAGRIDALALVLFMSLGAVPFLCGILAFHGLQAPKAGYFLPALSALTLNFLASLAFVHSVKLSPLSRTIPLLSLTPVFTVLAAVPLLDELPSPGELAGIALVVAGAMALSSGGSLRGVTRGLLREKGVVLMALVALMWAVTGPLDKLAIEHASVYFHATAMTLGVGLGALGTLAWQGRLSHLRSFRGEAKYLVATMVCITVALTFQLLAIRVVLVSLVEAFKRATGSIMAVVVGRTVFREKVGWREWLSVAVMVLGVFLILG
jgi:drug/metabolite transporter (DMT)-like permease